MAKQKAITRPLFCVCAIMLPNVKKIGIYPYQPSSTGARLRYSTPPKHPIFLRLLPPTAWTHHICHSNGMSDGHRPKSGTMQEMLGCRFCSLIFEIQHSADKWIKLLTSSTSSTWTYKWERNHLFGQISSFIWTTCSFQCLYFNRHKIWSSGCWVRSTTKSYLERVDLEK